MPTIWNCPACTQETSREMLNCPHCGHPFSPLPGNVDADALLAKTIVDPIAMDAFRNSPEIQAAIGKALAKQTEERRRRQRFWNRMCYLVLMCCLLPLACAYAERPNTDNLLILLWLGGVFVFYILAAEISDSLN